MIAISGVREVNTFLQPCQWIHSFTLFNFTIYDPLPPVFGSMWSGRSLKFDWVRGLGVHVTRRIRTTKVFLDPNYFSEQKDFSNPKFSFRPNIFFRLKNCSHPNFSKYFLTPKFFLKPHVFQNQDFFWPKIIFGTQFFFQTQNFFRPKMNFNENNVWREKTEPLN